MVVDVIIIISILSRFTMNTFLASENDKRVPLVGRCLYTVNGFTSNGQDLNLVWPLLHMLFLLFLQDPVEKEDISD